MAAFAAQLELRLLPLFILSLTKPVVNTFKNQRLYTA